MERGVIIKITLPPEEILATKLLLCPVNDCSEHFTNVSHLQMHISRRHKLPPSRNAVEAYSIDEPSKHFHCPEEACVYHVRASGTKFFNSFRSLKQHYLKMHSEKHFICSRCQKSFATQSLLRAHQTNCGQVFVCKFCDYSYGSREALLTHSKRKNHGYHELIAEKACKRKVNSKTRSSKALKSAFDQTQYGYSKIIFESTVLADKKSQTTQTENLNEEMVGVRNECSTQTFKPELDELSSASTLTVDNFCQTNYLDRAKPVYFEENSCKNQQQYNVEATDSIISVCSETQTDLIYDTMFPNEDRADPMLYSHMYTQTCDDIFSEFGLTTIETQTNWDGLGEFLVSTETQTNLNRFGSPEMADNRDRNSERISSIQTQTSASMEFLNAISSESSSTHTQTS
ncbi:uncharacterized protein LOC131692659 [Topomyia yanbarensis]|uniref:uncharacterized protein LOC131692659 n=1 Tax=Topomyia yanbarensis TaxID=2498891 RepID=UPI00273AF670|nr:uncharacterized protein LOC131692659 [Topomyia yanbarensis]